MKNIVVLGGGTAGWLAALLVNRTYPEFTVTVVESEDIGILGAGEGTVPDFVTVLDFLGIPVAQIIKHCDGTLKLGIRFENWLGNGNHYFHEFTNNLQDASDTRWPAYYQKFSNDESIKPLQLNYQLACQGLTPFTVDDQCITPFALHFNARKLAVFLREVAQDRGVLRREGRMVAVKSHENTDIQALVLENAQEIPGDFFFDCSGFARLLIGKHYQTPWLSYQQHLPMDSAMPFFIPHDNTNILPQTSAIAMNSGWVWKIPVRDRYGCGYVYDSRFLDQDTALKELEEYFKVPIHSPKTFRFRAGTYENCLVRNCLAVGLSQGFIEPLEATSIWTTCLTINSLLVNDLINHCSSYAAEMFNARARERNQTVVDFLWLHYFKARRDTPFWAQFDKVNEPLPKIICRVLHWAEYGLLPNQNLDPLPTSQEKMFETVSWLQVSEGMEHFRKEPFRRLLNYWPDPRNTMVELEQSIQYALTKAVHHDKFIADCLAR